VNSRRDDATRMVAEAVAAVVEVGVKRSLEGSPRDRRLLQRHARRDPYNTMRDSTAAVSVDDEVLLNLGPTPGERRADASCVSAEGR
jgi:hypothetical protein